MEENYQEQEDQENDDSEIDSQEDVDSEEVDSDDENYGAYTVASKDDFVTFEVKSKAKTKGGKQNVQNTGKINLFQCLLFVVCKKYFLNQKSFF